MFLGGVGLLPLECGFSGLLTIIWVMAATFVGTFFYLLNQSHPCSTALGECRTISCICGNAIPEGYVFMFVVITANAVIVLQHMPKLLVMAGKWDAFGENVLEEHIDRGVFPNNCEIR